jgi:hypothetical protein
MSEQTDHSERQLRFVIRLLIKHPSIDPTSISEQLGLIPHLTQLAGTERVTPGGTKLLGLHRESVWGWSKRVHAKRQFFDEVVAIIDLLEAHRSFLCSIAETGGRIELITDLPGDINIGSSITWKQMERLCKMKIDLGVEVYPLFDR